MDIRKIKKLIEMLQESDLNEIEVTQGEESVKISRGGSFARVDSIVSQAPISASQTSVQNPYELQIPSFLHQSKGLIKSTRTLKHLHP